MPRRRFLFGLELAAFNSLRDNASSGELSSTLSSVAIGAVVCWPSFACSSSSRGLFFSLLSSSGTAELSTIRLTIRLFAFSTLDRLTSSPIMAFSILILQSMVCPDRHCLFPMIARHPWHPGVGPCLSISCFVMRTFLGSGGASVGGWSPP